MKKIIKQPWLWTACCCFLAALAIAIVSSASRPNIPALARLEKGLNRQNIKTVLKAFSPSAQQESAVLGALGLDSLSSMDFEGKINIIYSEPAEDVAGNITVQVFFLYNLDGQCTEADHEEFNLEEADGKLYLSY